MNHAQALPYAAALIGQHEGNRLKVYRDPLGILTIGRGRNLEARGISSTESDELLRNDILEAVAFLEILIPTWPLLSPIRQAVAVDMYHALGPARFLKFKKFRAALAELNFTRAAYEIANSQWVLDLQRIRKRSDKKTRPEILAEIFRTELWPPDYPKPSAP